MEKFRGHFKDLSINYSNENYNITFESEQDISSLPELLKDKEVDITVAVHREKRGLDANSYFWVLCDKLSQKIGIPPSEIYSQYIKDVGGNYLYGCYENKDVDKLVNVWEGRGLGWVCEVTDSKLKGCSNIKAYYGSSSYNTEQMSRLINLVVNDCNSNGIVTESNARIRSLIESWDENP